MTPPAERRPPPGYALVRMGEVDSTQTVAFELASEDAADRTVVVATSQRAGRGRRGRVWRDEPGASLLLSIVIRPRLEPARWPFLSLMTAVAVARALGRVAGVPARLRWPNDVLVGGRKVAGILLESRLGPPPVVVIGIGINVGPQRFPPALEARATSIAQAGGRQVDRELVLAAVLEEFETWRGRLEGQGFAGVREAWKALSATLGTRVSVDGTEGQAVDLDEEGALVLDDGVRRHRMLAGELLEEVGGVAGR